MPRRTVTRVQEQVSTNPTKARGSEILPAHAISGGPPGQPDAALSKASASILAQVSAIEVKDKASAERAGTMLVQLKGLLESIEKERLFFTKPLNDQMKAINAKFHTLTDPLTAADKQLRAKVVQFKAQERQAAEQARLEAERKAREAEDKRLAAEHAKGKGKVKAEREAQEAAQEAQEAAQGFLEAAPAPISGVGGQSRWTFEVTDLSQVPREYLELSAPAVRAAIREGKREIPGLRIFKQEGLAVGRS